MPCVHCSHCRETERLADLRLPPVGSATFYIKFADRYQAARLASRQPAKLLREANPGLTPEQVKWYRRRCVDLGLLERVREAPVPVESDEVPAVTMDPVLAASLEAGAQLSVRLIQLTTPHTTPAAAREYLDELRAAGLVEGMVSE